MQGVRQEKIKLPVLVSEVRKSVVELLKRPVSELVDHQAFKTDQKILALWAADCAEHVLPYFEEKHPKDDRPRKAIEACRAWVVTGLFKMADVRKASLAAHAAAREAKEDDAVAAARAAGQAVATAHVPTHSIGAAAYAIKAATAHSNNVGNSIIKERNWQLQRLKMYSISELTKTKNINKLEHAKEHQCPSGGVEDGLLCSTNNSGFCASFCKK